MEGCILITETLWAGYKLPCTKGSLDFNLLPSATADRQLR